MTSTAIGLHNNVVTLWESLFVAALLLVAGFAYYGVIGALTSSIQVLWSYNIAFFNFTLKKKTQQNAGRLMSSIFPFTHQTPLIVFVAPIL